MGELLGLNARDVAGAAPDDRDRQTAEFFFHVVSATEVLAQYVNELNGLGLASHLVSVPRVSDALGTGSPASTAIGRLYVNMGNTAFPPDPYTDAALIYRMLVYRNHTAHHRRAHSTSDGPSGASICISILAIQRKVLHGIRSAMSFRGYSMSCAAAA